LDKLAYKNIDYDFYQKVANWYNRNMITQHLQNAGASYKYNLHQKSLRDFWVVIRLYKC